MIDQQERRRQIYLEYELRRLKREIQSSYDPVRSGALEREYDSVSLELNHIIRQQQED